MMNRAAPVASVVAAAVGAAAHAIRAPVLPIVIVIRRARPKPSCSEIELWDVLMLPRTVSGAWAQWLEVHRGIIVGDWRDTRDHTAV